LMAMSFMVVLSTACTTNPKDPVPRKDLNSNKSANRKFSWSSSLASTMRGTLVAFSFSFMSFLSFRSSFFLPTLALISSESCRSRWCALSNLSLERDKLLDVFDSELTLVSECNELPSPVFSFMVGISFNFCRFVSVSLLTIESFRCPSKVSIFFQLMMGSFFCVPARILTWSLALGGVSLMS